MLIDVLVDEQDSRGVHFALIEVSLGRWDELGWEGREGGKDVCRLNS